MAKLNKKLTHLRSRDIESLTSTEKEKMMTEKVTKTKKGICRTVLSLPGKFLKETWDEFLQAGLLIHLARLLGMKKEGGGKMADDDKKVDSIGESARLFHVFSDKDEIKYAALLTEVRKLFTADGEEKFVEFVEKIIQAGFDEDTFRVRLIGLYTTKGEEDSAISTVKAIIDSHDNFDKQVAIAKDRKLLVKRPIKSFGLSMWRNKLLTLSWIIALILGIAVGITILLDSAFG